MNINNVPPGAEEAVKKMAMVAIERHLKPKISDIKIKTFEGEVDVILVANGYPKKYEEKEHV